MKYEWNINDLWDINYIYKYKWDINEVQNAMYFIISYVIGKLKFKYFHWQENHFKYLILCLNEKPHDTFLIQNKSKLEIIKF